MFGVKSFLGLAVDASITGKFNQNNAAASYPTVGSLLLPVFEAVFEVVCVSLPGYILARHGLFEVEMQKSVANLALIVFTPCLIFIKLASQLTLEKFEELGIIVVIFAVQSLVSYLCGIGTSKALGLGRRARNFVVAMAVFGNSTSIPMSIVVSLSQTLGSLRWHRLPNDSSNEVAARGILYLLVFQQLGLVLRWSWGFNVLLAAPKATPKEENREDFIDDGQSARRYHDDPTIEGVQAENVARWDSTTSQETLLIFPGQEAVPRWASSIEESDSSESSESGYESGSDASSLLNIAPLAAPTWTNLMNRTKRWLTRVKISVIRNIRATMTRAFQLLPKTAQMLTKKIGTALLQFLHGVWDFMNPPLWAMLAALLVAGIPAVQAAFFTHGTFINNSFIRAVNQAGDVAIPLILVVLGANLAMNTNSNDLEGSENEINEERHLLFASLVSRMVLPTLVMAPLLILTVKFVSVSILDDPIFIVVCFLISGAPSALQLAQICQINGVYLHTMTRLLFHSYVIWVFPTTFVLIICGVKVVDFKNSQYP